LGDVLGLAWVTEDDCAIPNTPRWNRRMNATVERRSRVPNPTKSAASHRSARSPEGPAMYTTPPLAVTWSARG